MSIIIIHAHSNVKATASHSQGFGPAQGKSLRQLSRPSILWVLKQAGTEEGLHVALLLALRAAR